MAFILQEIQEIGGNKVDQLFRVVLNQAAAFTIMTKNVDHGEAGVIMVHCVGVDAQGNSMTGAKMVRYRKTNLGVLTLGTIQNVLAVQTDTGMTGCNFNMAAVNEHIAITVTGVAAKNIAWQITVNPQNFVSINYF
jgi:hypothetical protein